MGKYLLGFLVFTALTGCSATVSMPNVTAGPQTKSPDGSGQPGSAGGKIDLTGRWSGYGTANPHDFWSVNYDWKDRPPIETDTRCKVELQIIQKPDELHIVSTDITFPDVPELGYFDAKLVDWLKFPSSPTTPTFFDLADFKLTETKTGSQEFNLSQMKRDGTVATAPIYGSLLSFKQGTLVVSSEGPYTGAYEHDSGEAYTSSRDFSFTWMSDGKVTLKSVEFWDYGSSVGHATDAKCEGVALTREGGDVVIPPSPPVPPPAPVVKPKPVATVPVKTISCTTHMASFEYIVPASVFDQALKIQPGSDQVANEQDIPITTYFYAEAHEHDLEGQSDGFAQEMLSDVSPLVLKAWRWNRTDGKAFRLSISEENRAEFELYSDSALQTFTSDSRFTVGKIYDYASTGGEDDAGITCSVF